MVVVVKCKKCGQEFPSKLVQTVNEQGLKNFTFESNNEYVCHVVSHQVTVQTIIFGNCKRCDLCYARAKSHVKFDSKTVSITIHIPTGPQILWCCFQTYSTSDASVLLVNTWLTEGVLSRSHVGKQYCRGLFNLLD